MNLEILNDRPERRASCRACNWDWLTEGEPGAHTCRTAPATPRDTLQARARAAQQVFLERELSIRNLRLAEITMSRIRRGRA